MEFLKLRKIIGSNVRQYRLHNKFSQEVLAEICGMNRSYIGAVERGEHNIGVDSIARLSLGLQIPVSKLIETAPDESSRKKEAVDNRPEVVLTPAVVLSKKRFLELIKQCALHRPDLVAIYLDRCGVRFTD